MKLWLCALATTVVTGCMNSSNNGNEGPNGGDHVAQKAVEMVDDVRHAVESNPRTYPEIDINALKAAIGRLKLFVRDQTFANGTETDAINNGFDRIEINRRRWPLLDTDQQMALLLHELLGLIGMEKDSYRISNRLLSAKNRFKAEAEYECSSAGRTCTIVMRFERSERAFMVRGQGCTDFPAYPFAFFRRLDNNTYSTNGECTEPEGDAPGMCSIRSGNGREWDTLKFLDGQEFFFAGYGREILECKAK